MSENAELEIVDRYRYVDRWWTSTPNEHLSVCVASPSGEKIVVTWSEQLGWSVASQRGKHVQVFEAGQL